MATTLVFPSPAPVARVRSHPEISPGVRTSLASRAATRTPGVTARSTSPARRPSQRSVRLTRRGRLAAFAASVLALAGVVMATGQMADASGQAAASQQTVVVQSGETLWGIARDVAPNHDPRAVIAQIRDLNDLGTRSIVAGQLLIVPVSA